MSHAERTGFRSLVYSGWHRPDKIKALLGVVRAAKLTMIDIDSCEACPRCKQPLALIETAHTQSTPKHAPITAMLARMAGIKAFSVSYYGDIERTRCSSCGRNHEAGDITTFIVRQIQPADSWNRQMSTQEYAEFLESLRTDHQCVAKAVA